MLSLGPESGELLGRVHLGQATEGSFSVQPGEEAGDGNAIASMRGAGALQLDEILAGLRQLARIRAFKDARLRPAQAIEDPGGGAAGIDQNPGAAQMAQRIGKLIGRPHDNRSIELIASFAGELALIEKPFDAAFSFALLGVENREGKRKRRVGHVTAPDIQQPGDGIRLGEDHGVGPHLPQLGGNLPALFYRCATGEAQGMRMDFAQRWLRPVVPDGVEGIVGAGNKASARALAIACQLADLTFRMQPGIVTELATSQVLLQPLRQRGLGYVAMLIEFGIAFLQRLQRVAAVDEESSPVLKHDSHASRSAEARQPAQPLRRWRDIFALMLISSWYEKAAEPSASKLVAQGGKALRLSRETAHPGKLEHLAQG